MSPSAGAHGGENDASPAPDRDPGAASAAPDESYAPPTGGDGVSDLPRTPMSRGSSFGSWPRSESESAATDEDDVRVLGAVDGGRQGAVEAVEGGAIALGLGRRARCIDEAFQRARAAGAELEGGRGATESALGAESAVMVVTQPGTESASPSTVESEDEEAPIPTAWAFSEEASDVDAAGAAAVAATGLGEGDSPRRASDLVFL